MLYNFTTISEPEQPDSSQQPESSNHGATTAYMKAKAQETQQKPQIIFPPLKKKNRLLPKEFNDTRLILCDNYTAQTMSGFTTSFIIIPQLASDHRAFHEYDWPMTINTVYIWLGHEELRNAQITA